jgi:hypothetical protein
MLEFCGEEGTWIDKSLLSGEVLNGSVSITL